MSQLPGLTPYPFQVTGLPQFHASKRSVLSSPLGYALVALGLSHQNFVPQVTMIDPGTSGAVSLRAEVVADGTFKVSAYDKDNTIAAATQGSVSGGAGTFNITPGQTTKIKVDGGTTYTKTWAGTGGSITSSGATYASLNTKTLDFTNGGYAAFALTVTFDNTCVDRASTITYLNTQFGLASAPLTATAGSGNELVISSTRKGTSATVTINPSGAASTALAALGFSAGQSGSGSGDAANLAAVTRVEAAAALNTVLTGATASGAGSVLTVTSNSYGDNSKIQLDATSTQSLGIADNNVHVGTGGNIIYSWTAVAGNSVLLNN